MHQSIRIARLARASKSNKSKKQIFLRVFPLWQKNNDFCISCQLSIEDVKWCKQKKCAKGTSVESQRINFEIGKLENSVYDCFSQYQKEHSKLDSKGFKSYLNNKLFGKGYQDQNQVNMSSICERYIELHASQLSKCRQDRYRFVNKKVNEFNQEKFGTPDVPLNKVNFEWWNGFKQYLSNQYNYKVSTLSGYLKVIKTSVFDAYKSGLIDDFPFKNCKITKYKSNPNFLNQEELNKIIAFKSSNERLQRARDLFVFCSNTGVAYADLRNLTINNLTRDNNGVLSLRLNRQKSKQNSFIPLSREAQEILNKYEDTRKKLSSDKLLPTFHLNCYNDLLKIISAHCGLNKKLTSHMARHTMATMWVSKGGTTESLQRILGHTKLDTTLIYAKVLNVKVTEEASLVFKRWAKKGGQKALIN